MGAAATAALEALFRILEENGGSCDSVNLKEFPDGSCKLRIGRVEVPVEGHGTRSAERSLPRRRELGWFWRASRDGLVEQIAVSTATRAVSLFGSWIPHLDGPLMVLWMLIVGPPG